jgi:dynein heavy chain
MVESVNARLEENLAMARTFNHREGLFGNDLTDYSQLYNCTKDFKPFSDLWLNTSTWFKRH